jgi:hypothetical protein
VKDLPVLVNLLNAASPFGFSNLVTNRTDFEGLKGRFAWRGDDLEFRNIHGSSSSVGLNVNGKANIDRNDLDLSGTVVPFSMLNSFIGAIPLIGDIITGGNDGGVLAVAYTINGRMSNPKISVNPASLLTPGFLRNIFFGDVDDAMFDIKKPTTVISPDNTPYPDRQAPSKIITNFNKGRDDKK